MKRPAILARMCLVALAAVFLSPDGVSAQESTRFVYFAPGHEPDRDSHSQTYAAGFGLERLLERHIGIQFDIAALSYFDADDSRTVGGIASFDAVFHASPQRKVELFGVAGYSVRFRDDTTNMFNYGAGVRHWFREDRALLVEIRDHRVKDQPVPGRFWSVRIGLVFR